MADSSMGPQTHIHVDTGRTGRGTGRWNKVTTFLVIMFFVEIVNMNTEHL